MYFQVRRRLGIFCEPKETCLGGRFLILTTIIFGRIVCPMGQFLISGLSVQALFFFMKK